jgi:hypothetical protein
LINQTIIMESYTLHMKQLQTSLDPVQNGFWLKHGFQSNDFSVTFRLHQRFRTKYLWHCLCFQFPATADFFLKRNDKWCCHFQMAENGVLFIQIPLCNSAIATISQCFVLNSVSCDNNNSDLFKFLYAMVPLFNNTARKGTN